MSDAWNFYDPVDLNNCSYFLTEENQVVPFKHTVGIFEHTEYLYQLMTCKAWLPLKTHCEMGSLNIIYGIRR